MAKPQPLPVATFSRETALGSLLGKEEKLLPFLMDCYSRQL